MIGKICLGVLAALALCAGAQAQNAAPAAPSPTATPPAPDATPAPSANPWARIHTVAIVSGIGTALTLQNDQSIGADTKPLDIKDWGIDAQVTAALRQYLGGRFAFTDVKYDPAAVAHVTPGEWDNSDHATRAFDATLAADGIDAFIIVRPSTDKSTPGPNGLALENRNSTDPRPVEWANYEIDIVDAKTFTLLAHAQSRIQPRTSAPPTFVAVMGTANLNVGSDLSLSDAQRTALQADFTRLVSQSLTETVRGLNLNVPLPAVGARNLVAIAPGEDPFAAIKTIAVVSAIGDQLNLQQSSTITRGDKQVPIADWHLDDQIESLAKDAMSKRFTIGTANVDRAALAGAEIVGSRGNVASSFPGLQPSSGVDAYVVFVKMPMPASSTGNDAGVGLWNSDSLFGGEAETDIFANYAIAVIDARTLKLITIVKATTSPKLSTPTPSMKGDATLWPAWSAPLTPEQSAKIHQALSDLLADSVPETLLRMGLTGMTIAGAAPVQTAAQ